MTGSQPPALAGCRAQARRLLHDLRGDDAARMQAAAARFARLRTLAAAGVAGVIAGRARVRLKHALAVVAEEQGFASWLGLKRQLAAPRVADPALPSFHTPAMHALLNRWFTDHAAARACRDAEGGWLLPFRHQFFVTESAGILALGLDPGDPDWQAIGWDVVIPRDPAALARLCAKRRAALAAGIGMPTPEPRRRRPPG